MKRLLMISYDFPPVGGVGVQRIIKLIKYLPENSIEPIVLTNAHALSAPKPNDPTLGESDYIKNTTVLRKGGENLVPYHRYKSTGNKTLYPYVLYLGIKQIWFMDIFKEWFDSCKADLGTIIDDFKIDCVLTTSPPHSVQFFGEHAKLNYNIPWIMDLRDSMAARIDRKPGTASNIQIRAQAHFEKRFLKNASHTMTVSEPMKENLLYRNGAHLSSKLSVLPNGFDPDDFTFDLNTEEPPHNDKMVITYTGSFTGQRTPRFFVDAFEHLIRHNTIDGKRFLIRFVGIYSDSTITYIRKLEESTKLELPGFVTHADAVKLQRDSTLLLLITAPGTGKHAAEVLTGKVFEYMAAGKPIFALAPQGPLRDIVGQGFGYVALPDDVTDIANTLQQIYSDWRDKGQLYYRPNQEFLRQYSRKEQARYLADIVKQVTL